MFWTLDSREQKQGAAILSTGRRLEHSQNFIRRQETVRRLLSLSNINSDDLVIEIGPGKGIITRELLRQAGRVIAVERDPSFFEQLSALDVRGKLQLVVGDFLKWQPPREDYKVFANIPFNYTSDIVAKLTSGNRMPTDIYLVMQEAAARRFAGMPHERNSQVSILLAVDFDVQILETISREQFEPMPHVEIAFTHFAQYPQPLVLESDRQEFRDFVVYGYNRWAPTALDAFRDVFSKKQISLIARSQSLAGMKPSDLSVDQWLHLFRTYREYADSKKKHLVVGSEKRLRNTQAKLQKSHRTRRRLE